MASPSVADVVAKARQLAPLAEDDDFVDVLAAALEPVRYMGLEAHQVGLDLLGGDHLSVEIGCMLLRIHCVEHADLKEPASEAVARLLETVTDDDVACALAGALGELGQPGAVAALRRLSHHADADVRQLVASALPSCSDPDYYGSDEVVALLLDLMTDPADQVRDWATFGVGTMLSADSKAIREALLARSTDAHVDTRYEAVLGLASRRDPRASRLVEGLLNEEEIFQLAIEAATVLADVRLHPTLLRLQEQWDPNALEIDVAVRACDPDAQDSELAMLREGLDQLGSRLTAAGLPYVPALTCERSWSSIELHVDPTSPGLTRPDCVWSWRELVERAADDVQQLVALVVQDLRDALAA